MTLRQMSLEGSRRRPLIFAVEDLHWIDKTSEECVASREARFWYGVGWAERALGRILRATGAPAEAHLNEAESSR